MGRHMTHCAAEINGLHLRLKLALMCFADSAHDANRIAFPGVATLAKWTGVKEAQVYNLINSLIELQLLARHKRGHRGQRAEYLLFPNGCCELHGKRLASTPSSDPNVVVQLSTASTDPVGPLEAIGGESLQFDAGKPLIPMEKASNSVPGKPLTGTLKSGRLQEISPVNPTDQPSTVVDVHQPLPSRASSVVDMDFSRVNDPPAGVRVAPPSGGRALGCRHCDAGWICDADGIPAGHCPHCHPAHRRAQGSA